MAITSKSPKHVLTVALEAATRALPEHPHRFAPKIYTCPQLFACLVLKVHQQQDYRGVRQLLIDCPELAAVIGLKKVPHFTTLQQAAERLLKSDDVQQLLESVLTLVRPGRRVTSDVSPTPPPTRPALIRTM